MNLDILSRSQFEYLIRVKYKTIPTKAVSEARIIDAKFVTMNNYINLDSNSIIV